MGCRQVGGGGGASGASREKLECHRTPALLSDTRGQGLPANPTLTTSTPWPCTPSLLTSEPGQRPLVSP